jgi:membrane protein YqaA with SNARE-associated domain
MVTGWNHFIQALLVWGPQGLLVLAVLDSAGVPVVGGVDALLIAIAVNKPSQAYLAAVCAIVGSLAGSLILFSIARKGGEVLLRKQLESRQGKRLHFWFERYGLVSVFIPALSPLPMPMKIPVFCAGALEVRWSYFIAVVLAARIIRYFSLAYLALHYGQQTFQFLRTHAVGVAGFAVMLALLAISVLQIVARRKAGRTKAAIMNS